MRPPRSRRVLRALLRSCSDTRAEVLALDSAARRPLRSKTLFLALLGAVALLCTTLALSMRIEALPHTRATLVGVRAAPADVAGAAGRGAEASPPGYPHAGATVGATLLRRAGAFAAEHAHLYRTHRAAPAQSAEAAFMRLAAAAAQPVGAYPSNRVAARAREAREAAATRRAQRRTAALGAVSPPQRAWPRLAADVPRRDAVVDAMRHAWGAYAQHAFGHDELDPLANTGKDGFGSLGASILDSLDTLYLMGLTAEFRRAADWAVANLTFTTPRAVESWDAGVEMHVSLFETNIRAVGGLLAAGSLSGEAALVARAADVAARLLPAFDTDSGVPTNWVQLARGGVRGAQRAILSEFATLSMEFLSTSALTGDPRYAELAEGALLAALRAPGRGSGEERGFMQTLLDPNGGGGFSGGRISFGGAGDSAYEYFIKTWLLMGRDDAFLPYRHLFDAAADSLAARLTRRSGSRLYIAEQVSSGNVAEQMEHLACFMAGTLVLAAEGARAERYMAYAEQLADTCYEMYSQQASGLAPDAVTMQGGNMAASDSHWQLRPETVESLFYLWRATGDPRHRERGWAIFQAIEKRCRVPGGGYAGLRDTVAAGRATGFEAGQLDGTQPSWFLAETLKYLFLLFAESDALDLEAWVLNTEAHPLRVVPPAARASPGAPAAASLLQGLAPDALVPGAPLPRGLREGGAATPPTGFAHDLPPGEQEEAWVADAWRRALSKPS